MKSFHLLIQVHNIIHVYNNRGNRRETLISEMKSKVHSCTEIQIGKVKNSRDVW